MKKTAFSDSLFIIDGSSFLYRAYHAIRPLHTREGKPVHAVYGFCRMIKKLLDAFAPTKMVLVFDSGGITARHVLYNQYKAKRQIPPTDLLEQKKIIQEFAALIGLPTLQQYGIEADDLMYSLAQSAVAQNLQVVLVTTDKDMGQAVNEAIILYDAFKEEFIDARALALKYGFDIGQLAFYFSLVGDTSDNIPGVRGIGHKKAVELVTQFNSLEDLYNNLDTLSSTSLRTILQEGRESAFLSYDLFLLRTYPLDIDPSTLEFSPSNWVQARDLFEQLEFKSLLKGLPVLTPARALSEDQGYTFVTVTTEQQLRELCVQIKEEKKCALDTETNGLDPLQSTLVGISLCVQKGTAYYIPLQHEQGEQLSRATVYTYIKPLLEDATIEKYMHHAKFDLLVLAAAGIYVQGLRFDTLIAAHLVLSEGMRLGLKYLSEALLGQKMLSYETVVTEQGYQNFAQVPLAQATEYAAADAHQTFLLKQLLEQELKKMGLVNLYYTIEFPLVRVLVSMEYSGIQVDVEVLKALDAQVTRDIEYVRSEIIMLAGPDYTSINLNSPRQLEQLLFEYLKLPRIKKTARKTAFSTDYEVLQELALLHEVPRLIVKYRELYKLKSTYIDKLPTYINSRTGKVHTTFHQTAVVTGRLSSSEPNLQNIPVQLATSDIQIRSAFKPDPGYMFLSADYSQIELRVLAYLSQDQTLLQAFAHKLDIHAQTAATIFQVPLELVNHDQRQIGKRINFSILYGLTPFGLSKDLGISYKQAQQYIARYFSQYPGVDRWMRQLIVESRKDGYVTTLAGRRRYAPGIYEKNKAIYEAAERIIINTRAQGTAAEIMKLGMINLIHALEQEQLGSKILLQIHDELLLMVPHNEIEKTEDLVKSVLQNVVTWNVPLIVTTRLGTTWQEVTK